MLRPSATSTGVSIQYTGDGVRVSETVAGITTQYLVDENNPTGYAQVVEELRGGTVQQRYSYGHDLISQTMVGAGATSFYTSDGLGSIRALTNSTGSVTDRYAYDAFGSALATTGSTANAYRFTGEQQDAALGMYYLRARYYQPGSGMFWTRDTWGLDQQHPREWNRYVYVAADPVNGVDPRGYATVMDGYARTNAVLASRAAHEAWLWAIRAAVVCVIARATSELGTALWIAQFGGERGVINPCATGVEKKTCADLGLITCDELLAIDYRYYHTNYASAFAEAQALWSRPIKKGGPQRDRLTEFPPCKGCTHRATREVKGGGDGPSIGQCPCCIEDTRGPRETKRFAVLLP